MNWLEKITEEERNWAIDQYPILEGYIDAGQWSYSRSALEKDFQGWKFVSWAATNKFLYILIVLVIVSFSLFTMFIPLVIAVVLQYMSEKKAENYKGIINKHKSGSLFNIQDTNPVNNFQQNAPKSYTSSSSDELSKLFDLLKAGAITQEEFDAQKKRILS